MQNLLVSKGEEITPQMRSELPQKFTNPLSYIPHNLTLEAMESLCTFVKEQMPYTWQQLGQDGKMMGVLVVESPQGELGYLAAFSGVLDTPENTEFFVPPVYDINSPDSFFPSQEAQISGINARIRELQEDSSISRYLQETEELKSSHLQKFSQLETAYREDKLRRDALRNSVDAEHQAQLIKQSQFQKGEIRRAKQRMKEELEVRQKLIDAHFQEIKTLEQERKERSVALQKKIFDHFIFLNAKGEVKSLLEIFRGVIPPAGAGECAAPRLLQYAFKHGYCPIAMGEFWMGAPTANRQPFQFYPSCKGKCAPILGFMLQGLNVDDTNFHTTYGCDPLPDNLTPEILYEDEYIIAVNKPAGILSVPGKDSKEKNLLQLLYDSAVDCGNLYVVHRLDMHTSGVLLVAKTEQMYKQMQKMFEGREVDKTYCAVLDGEVSEKLQGRGVVWKDASISLPLAPDYENRPLQKVDYEQGKSAETQFEIKAVMGGKTFVEFHPITGRTHQLRVHSASAEGLNTPIVGDLLYGKPAQRLMLHAHKVKFQHPYKGVMEIVAPLPEGFSFEG